MRWTGIAWMRSATAAIARHPQRKILAAIAPPACSFAPVPSRPQPAGAILSPAFSRRHESPAREAIHDAALPGGTAHRIAREILPCLHDDLAAAGLDRGRVALPAPPRFAEDRAIRARRQGARAEDAG